MKSIGGQLAEAVTDPGVSVEAASHIPKAAIYLRVSTKDQAEAGGEREGFSIPAQREACLRKAESLGAVVVEEFVDRGESAKSANRPELQRLLKYVGDNPVDYVIVHKVDRLARNRVDDVSINVILKQSGVTLVSVTENIDETPSGILLHGIMSSIAEFYSRNLASEVMKGIMQKVRKGGTVGKAPLGYRNVIRTENGREARMVELDTEMAPLMREAFQLYATGDWTLRTLLDHLTARGLLIPPTVRSPQKPMALSHFNRLLRNPYYIGIVTYQGVRYAGAHQPLVSRELWDRVQAVLTAHDAVRGTKQRKHAHYLKGMLYCHQCGSRFSIEHVRGKGGQYSYFFCLGRHTKRTSCTQKALSFDFIETEVLKCWTPVRLTKKIAADVEAYVLGELGEHRKSAEAEAARQRRRSEKLRGEQMKLLQAHYAEAVPLDLLKIEQDRIGRELESAELALSRLQTRFEVVEANLRHALTLATNVQRAYREAGPQLRRWLNQAFFTKFEVYEDGSIRADLAEPFNLLLHAGTQLRARSRAQHAMGARVVYLRALPAEQSEEDDDRFFFGQGLKDETLVGKGGFDPRPPRPERYRDDFPHQRVLLRCARWPAIFVIVATRRVASFRDRLCPRCVPRFRTGTLCPSHSG